MAEGRKDDHGKLPYHLLPPELMEGIAAVLEFGAKKYSILVENEWHALLLVPVVKRIRISTQTGLVVAAMKNSYGKPILSMLNVNAKTGATGSNVTDIVCESWQSADEMILSLVRAISAPNGSCILENLASRKTLIENSATKAAPSAAQSNIFTLTIVTERNDFAVSFAPDAITDLGFWTTVWRDLNAQSGISRPQNKSGERNWEAGMAWSRPFAALMRHMWAWWRGEKADTGTGMSHLWHAGCCLAFLIAYERRRIGTDDRPSIYNAAECDPTDRHEAGIRAKPVPVQAASASIGRATLP